MHKKQVPTYGACILNETLSKVLLVRGWKSSSWGWPKGKVNKNEDELVCAAREVAEEIGFDISSYISASNVLSCKVGDVLMKLYVVAGVPEDTHFETQTRKEISEIKWHTLRNLGEETGPKMYSVSPVLGRLRGWVSDHMRSLSRSKTPDRECSDSAPMSSSSSPRTRKGRRAAKEGIVKEEVDAAGVARDNEQTFGSGSSKNFSVEDMFRVNKEKFGIESTYNFEQYTTKLHKQSERKVDAHKCMYAERYRPCQIRDVASSTDGGSVCTSSRSSVVGDEVESSIEEKTCLVGFMFDRDAILGCMTFV